MDDIDLVELLGSAGFVALPAPRTLSHALGYGGLSRYVAWWQAGGRVMFCDGRIAAATAGDAVWAAFLDHPRVKPLLSATADPTLIVAESVGKAYAAFGDRERLFGMLTRLANQQDLPRPVEQVPDGDQSRLDDLAWPDRTRLMEYSARVVRTGWPGGIGLGMTEQATAYAESLIAWLNQQLPPTSDLERAGEGGVTAGGFP